MSAASQPNDVKAQFEQTYSREELSTETIGENGGKEAPLSPYVTLICCC